MLLRLSNIKGKKRYIVEKIMRTSLLDKSQAVKEEFLLEIEIKRNGEKPVIEFKVIEYYNFNHNIFQQILFNLYRNRIVEFNEEGSCVKCLNIEEIVKKWEIASEKIKEGIINHTKNTDEGFRMAGKLLRNNKSMKYAQDIYSVFFPPIYGKVIENSYRYEENIKSFCGVIDIPLKVSSILEYKNAKIYISSKAELNDVYFKQNILKDGLEYFDIKWNTNKKLLTPYYDYELYLDKEDFLPEYGSVKIGGEIEGILSNCIVINIKGVKYGN